VQRMLGAVARAAPLSTPLVQAWLGLAVVPLLGSLITEPAAMTLAALMLASQIFKDGIPEPLKYGALGVLFVNISIGGTLTSYAAPPVLMVAATWGWDSAFMASTFGWKAAVAVLLNTLGLAWCFRRELAALPLHDDPHAGLRAVPWSLVAVHLGFHLGQAGYLRRTLTGGPASAGAMGIQGLVDPAL